jgi:hypothetical protein
MARSDIEIEPTASGWPRSRPPKMAAGVLVTESGFFTGSSAADDLVGGARARSLFRVQFRDHLCPDLVEELLKGDPEGNTWTPLPSSICKRFSIPDRRPTLS